MASAGPFIKNTYPVKNYPCRFQGNQTVPVKINLDYSYKVSYPNDKLHQAALFTKDEEGKIRTKNDLALNDAQMGMEETNKYLQTHIQDQLRPATYLNAYNMLNDRQRNCNTQGIKGYRDNNLYPDKAPHYQVKQNTIN
jgi:hypothetical protein